MTLSNTATPLYYGEFRDRVLSGEIPVCEEISMEMNRIDALIASPNFYYDDSKIDGFIHYCENEMTLTDGGDVEMLFSFKVWAEQVLSWFYFVDRTVPVPNPKTGGIKYERRRIKKRLTKKQYLIVGRGAAKSMYMSFLQSYILNIDTTTTTQVVVAPTVRQAGEILGPIKTAISRSKGPLFKYLTQGTIHNTTGGKHNQVQLASTKLGIQNFLTGSIIEIRPMAIDKLQGLRNKLSTVDEWLSGDTREDVIGALEQGADKDDMQYIIVAASSEGTVRNGVGDSIKMELQSILRGEYMAPHVSIWHYKLDAIEEVDNPEMWIKANPNLGLTVTYEAYQRDVDRAASNPTTRNDILAKRFGIPREGYTYFFTYEETQTSRARSYWGMPCGMGADLSQGDDFCAFSFLFPLPRGQFGVKTRSYITEDTMLKLAPSMRIKYEEFINEGTLIVMPGVILNMVDVYDDIDRHIIENEYDVRTFGYDPYNAKEFVERYSTDNGPFGVEKVIQGSRTESVPLGELKKISENGDLLFDEKLMSFAMGNTIVIEDTNGNRKLSKRRKDEKIDNFASTMDAWVGYRRNPDLYD